jgi:hypothetical protein
VSSTTVYWTDLGSGAVLFAPIGGGTVTTFASGLGGPDQCTVDGTSVYWTNNADGTVVSLSIGSDGGAPTTLASGQTLPEGIAVDATYVSGPTRPILGEPS